MKVGRSSALERLLKSLPDELLEVVVEPEEVAIEEAEIRTDLGLRADGELVETNPVNPLPIREVNEVKVSKKKR